MPHVGERVPLPDDGDPDAASVAATEATAASVAAVEADVDRLLAEHSPQLQAIERALRVTIRSAFPAAVE
jgi:hypothetical protein